MDCRDFEFSPSKSDERINRALDVFPEGLLMRLLAFALHLLGGTGKPVASRWVWRRKSARSGDGLCFAAAFAALRTRPRLEAPPGP